MSFHVLRVGNRTGSVRDYSWDIFIKCETNVKKAGKKNNLSVTLLRLQKPDSLVKTAVKAIFITHTISITAAETGDAGAQFSSIVFYFSWIFCAAESNG